MSSSELQTMIVDMMLVVTDIHDKLSKFGTPELEKLVNAVITSSKRPPLIKKLYDLETQIGKFRNGSTQKNFGKILFLTQDLDCIIFTPINYKCTIYII